MGNGCAYFEEGETEADRESAVLEARKVRFRIRIEFRVFVPNSLQS